MAEDKKAEDTTAEMAEETAGAKPSDTAAETRKPDSDKGVEDAEAKKPDEPVAKVDDKNAKEGGKPAEKSAEKKTAEKKPPAEKKPAAKKKKEKPPKIEDKPFNEFMEQHYLPSLKEAMAAEGIDELSLEFAKRKLEVMGQSDSEAYWQVQGQWEETGEGTRRFNIAFLDEDISGQKVFTLTENDAMPSTIEQFMGDERRITLGLMVLYTVQRLNGQKWLTRN